ncbi:MAG: PorP/SprF family type IX secretion system membrane protein [Sphingobacteriaceae bacterium]|nr:PorP/SprF family type IX secretion system membrane protein [Sphingobacteriaceae bacterium]
MIKKQILLLFFLNTMGFSAFAQDPLFSQFFNAPSYLNPSLVGQFDGDYRVSVIYKNQLSVANGELTYLNALADFYIPNFGSLGISFNRSSEGIALLNRNNFALTYAYELKNDYFTSSFGIEGGISNRSIIFRKLIFADQIIPEIGVVGGSVSGVSPTVDSSPFFDAGAGASIVFSDFFLGAAYHHLNSPVQSFVGGKSTLSPRLTLNASYRFALNQYSSYYTDNNIYVIPSVVYYSQNYSKSLSTGLQLKYKTFNAGAWYRSNTQGGADALVFSLVYTLSLRSEDGESLRMGYSHDTNTSKTGNDQIRGNNEFSVGYQKYWATSSRFGVGNGLRCFNFY